MHAPPHPYSYQLHYSPFPSHYTQQQQPFYSQPQTPSLPSQPAASLDPLGGDHIAASRCSTPLPAANDVTFVPAPPAAAYLEPLDSADWVWGPASVSTSAAAAAPAAAQLQQQQPLQRRMPSQSDNISAPVSPSLPNAEINLGLAPALRVIGPDAPVLSPPSHSDDEDDDQDCDHHGHRHGEAAARSDTHAKVLRTTAVTGEPRRYACGQCDRTFTRKYNLDSHMLVHQNLKPFKCDRENCTDSFVRRYDLRRHIRTLHDQHLYGPCPGCQRKYTRVDSFRKHVRICVPGVDPDLYLNRPSRL
nr:hypothetical protein HK105_000719 [Polyrhizophydium stewartii]